jgi:predicted enzyme related to lactoylglutathione lyase
LRGSSKRESPAQFHWVMKSLLSIITLFSSLVSLGQTEKPIIIESLFQVILNVKDMERQVKFYKDVLGLKIIYPAESKNIHLENFVRFETGGANLVLHAGRQTKNAGQEPRISFRVSNLKAAREFMLKSKVSTGEIRNPAPGVYVLDCKDPEGNIFHLESFKSD